MWNTRTWSSSSCGSCFWVAGCFFRYLLYLAQQTTQRLLPVAAGKRSGVLSHTLQTNEVGLLGPGFAAVDCCVVVANELQAEFIYEHVEGAKAVAGTGVGSV